MFDRPYLLEKHLERKTPCDAIMEIVKYNTSANICQYCRRSYTTLGSLKRHQQTACKILNGGMELLAQETIRRENLELKTEMGEMKKIMRHLIKKSEHSRNSQDIIGNTNNITNNTITQNNNSLILNFNPVRLVDFTEHDSRDLVQICLTDDDLSRIGSLVCNRKTKEAAKLIIHRIHNNEDHPEGMNIFYSASTGRYMAYIDPQWGPVALKMVLKIIQTEVIRGISMASWEETENDLQSKVVDMGNMIVMDGKFKLLLGDTTEKSIKKIPERPLLNNAPKKKQNKDKKSQQEKKNKIKHNDEYNAIKTNTPADEISYEFEEWSEDNQKEQYKLDSEGFPICED